MDFYYFCMRMGIFCFAHGYHTDLVRGGALTVFEHESHELNEYFIAHGSHGSHGSLPTAVLDYEILRFLMRHIKGHP